MVLRDVETGEMIVPYPSYFVFRRNGDEVCVNYTTWSEKCLRNFDLPLGKGILLECTAYIVNLEGELRSAGKKFLPQELFPNTFKKFAALEKINLN